MKYVVYVDIDVTIKKSVFIYYGSDESKYLMIHWYYTEIIDWEKSKTSIFLHICSCWDKK